MNSESITEIDVNLLQPNPLQPRGLITSESLMELADSIRQQGILQPLVIAETPAGYQIIAGERRWRAAKMAGFAKIPVIVKKTTARGMLEMALVENVQREDLNALERALAYRRLMDEFQMTVTEIAKKVGKSQPFISNTLRLLSVPDALKDGLLSGFITEGHVRALLALEKHDLMIEAYKTLLRESGSVRRAEELTRRMMASKSNRRQREEKTEESPLSDLEKKEKEIARLIHGKVKILHSRLRASVTIVIQGTFGQTAGFLERFYQVMIENFPHSVKEA